MKTIGLLAGIGRLPVDFARAARGMGFTVIAIGLVSEVDPALEQAVDQYASISIGELDKIINTLKEAGVGEVTMIGKVTKELMFNGAVKMDSRSLRLLASLPDHSDDTIMLAFVRELLHENIRVLDQTRFIRALMPPPGLLTRRAPTPGEESDMRYGFKMAKQIGDIDVGQTVVVKNGAVMAVEAIEGTDACIRRGGQLGRGGVVIAKVAKPNQDMRFDVPCIGANTIRSMIEANAVAMVIEAGRTLIVEREEAIRLADDHNIAIIAMPDEE